jgi:hypothetical protein
MKNMMRKGGLGLAAVVLGAGVGVLHIPGWSKILLWGLISGAFAFLIRIVGDQ